MNFFSPAEICDNMVKGCNNKAKLSIGKMMVLGIFAGVFIAFGAYGFTVITSGAGTGFEATFAKYIGAGVFPVGLMLVVICGAELFTGNNLMTLSLFKKEITVGAMLRNWGVVWVANLIGSLLLAWLMSQSGLYGEAMTAKAIGIAEAKCAIPLMPVIIRAIFCNMLVCLAVWMQSGEADPERQKMLDRMDAWHNKIMSMVGVDYGQGKQMDSLAVLIKNEQIAYCNKFTPRYRAALRKHLAILRTSMPDYQNLGNITAEVTRVQTGIEMPAGGTEIPALKAIDSYLSTLRDAYDYKLYFPEDEN